MYHTPLNEEIMNSIARQLPEMAVGELKKFISQAETNSKHLSTTIETLDKVQGRNDILEQENNKLQQLARNEQQIKDDREILKEKERDFRVKEAELLRDCASQKVDLIRRLVDQVFKNKHIVYNTYGSIPVARAAGPGYEAVEQHSVNTTTTLLNE
jgi:cell shape-determining protein MreC